MTEHHLSLAQQAGTHYAVGGVLALFLLAYVVLFVRALLSVLRSPHSGGMKLVWCVVILAAPFLGSLAWFVIGRSDAYRTRYYGQGYQ